MVKLRQGYGLQPCGNVWVMGKNLRLDCEGVVIDERDYRYLSLQDIITQVGNVAMHTLLPSITQF